MKFSLRFRLTIIFIGLAVGPLLIVGARLAQRSFDEQGAQALSLQQQVVQRVSTELNVHLRALESDVTSLLGQLRGLEEPDRAQQISLMLGAFTSGPYQNTYEEFTLLDNIGREQLRISRQEVIPAQELGNRLGLPEFERPRETGETYFSPVTFDEQSGQSILSIAIPFSEPRSVKLEGILIATIRFNTVEQLITAVRLSEGQTQTIYVVDSRGQVVAHQDHAGLSDLRFDLSETDGQQMGLNGTDVILATDQVTLGGQVFTVVAERPAAEALAPANRTVNTLAGTLLITLAVAITLGFLVIRQIVRPIEAMSNTAQAISSGDLSQRVPVTSRDEIGTLAQAFNSMTAQLRGLIDSLEQRVFIRTRRLDMLAVIGGELNATLDQETLLAEVVNQVKDNFAYYHVQIFLLDARNEYLILAEGSGEAGEEMKRLGYRIPMVSTTNPVARAARTRDIVKIDNILDLEGGQPHDLLPNSASEMAVPIVLGAETEVIGVLDVQEDKVDGLDDGDINLLRSLANQVATALSNTRLFEQTILAKEQAEQAREEAENLNKTLEVQIWQTMGQAQLSDKMRGEQDLSALATSVIQQLCKYVYAHIGALYIARDNKLHLAGHYAYNGHKPDHRFEFGEGLVGQTAVEKIPRLLTDIPEGYIKIRSGLGEAPPKNIMLFPFMYDNQVMGVIELGALTPFNQAQMAFIETVLPSIAIAFNTARARTRIDELLAETQRQAEELQAQGEELRVANEELEAQTESLRDSEARLREKQDQLEATNTQLEEKAAALEQSSVALRDKQGILDRQNHDLKQAQQELEKRAEELALASKYKSEFLANMSHELRTPLNSVLILARILAENEAGNLSEEQVQSAEIIYSGGNDLLNLINGILDLSKVEAGKLTFTIEPVSLSDLVASLQAQFAYLAEEKGLDFQINVAEDLPTTIDTDQQRIKQIINNMLSNAFKFTRQGSVRLDLYRPTEETDLARSGLDPQEAIAISVADSGIGMTPEQQAIIFEAFQQADGSTSRQYGGTGLGLSISRELAIRLGGHIHVDSQPGEGSTFTLYLPIEAGIEPNQETPLVQSPAMDSDKEPEPAQPDAETAWPIVPQLPTRPTPQPALADDRDDLDSEDKILLIVEDDPTFAEFLLDFAHKKGFKGLIALDGHTGLDLVHTYDPDAIILDLNLPDITGWEVMQVLKIESTTRHIPIHIISADDEVLDAFRKGAIGYLTKPVTPESLTASFQKIEQFIAKQIKSLLLVEDDANARHSIKLLLGGSDVQITEVDQGQAALDMLQAQRFDCIILDLSLPDMSGFEVLNKMNGDQPAARCPVIVYTGRELTPEENHELMKYADSVIVKGVKSPERLLDETALFLHRVVADMPRDKQQTIKQLYNTEGWLKDKRILIVDDDMRNSFALSKLLSDKGLIVKIAQDGQKALDLLAKEKVDLVLMDIMMPVMDGYETTRRIRSQPELRHLPVLALTAKAMKGDREKCLEAGANDYLSKPIDVDRLFSMLRVWLY